MSMKFTTTITETVTSLGDKTTVVKLADEHGNSVTRAVAGLFGVDAVDINYYINGAWVKDPTGAHRALIAAAGIKS